MTPNEWGVHFPFRSVNDSSKFLLVCVCVCVLSLHLRLDDGKLMSPPFLTRYESGHRRSKQVVTGTFLLTEAKGNNIRNANEALTLPKADQSGFCGASVCQRRRSYSAHIDISVAHTLFQKKQPPKNYFTAWKLPQVRPVERGDSVCGFECSRFLSDNHRPEWLWLTF